MSVREDAETGAAGFVMGLTALLAMMSWHLLAQLRRWAIHLLSSAPR